MKRRKLYKHMEGNDSFGIRTKIKNFIKPRVTKANRDRIVTS